jgi:hypothetical protein
MVSCHSLLGLEKIPSTSARTWATPRSVIPKLRAAPSERSRTRLRTIGPRCCSGADGTALSDADWEVRDGHYRVRIKSQWWDVPEQAVIKEPNRAGRTMVWPFYEWTLGKPLRIDIRRFMPGAMI